MEIIRFNRNHLDAVVNLCAAHGWESYSEDAERAWRALTAPGVITIVAVDDGKVLGFASVLTDGEICSYLSLIAVVQEYQGRGIGKRLVKEIFNKSKSARQGLDLLSTEGADEFFESFAYTSFPGYRIYPPFTPPAKLSQ
jgi:predicted N-acetyltransferase YhbS